MSKLYSIKPGLKKARKAANLTQQQLADQFNVSLKTVMNWEQGLANPDLEDVIKLADLLHCDIDFLTGRIDCQTHDLQHVHDLTGLSEDAIKKVIAINDLNRVNGMTDTLSRLIENRRFTYLLSLLPVSAPGHFDTMTIDDGVNHAHIHDLARQAVLRSEIKSTIDKISDDIRAQSPADHNTAVARLMFGVLYSLRDDGTLSEDQFRQTLAAYDKGDYDFMPPPSE